MIMASKVSRKAEKASKRTGVGRKGGVKVLAYSPWLRLDGWAFYDPIEVRSWICQDVLSELFWLGTYRTNKKGLEIRFVRYSHLVPDSYKVQADGVGRTTLVTTSKGDEVHSTYSSLLDFLTKRGHIRRSYVGVEYRINPDS
jgi:hypothetical protein